MTVLHRLNGKQMVELAKRWKSGHNLEAIADAMGLSVGHTLDHARRMGLIPESVVSQYNPQYEVWSTEKRQAFAEQWERGDSIPELAQRYGVTRHAISQRAKRAGLTPRKRGKKPSQANPKAT